MSADLDGLDGWVPFSTRYGIASDDRFADHEGHNRHTEDAPAAPDRQRCDCLGTSRLRCAAYADNEDLICAECRAWCWGVTPSGTRVPLPRRAASQDPVPADGDDTRRASHASEPYQKVRP